ncbi:hypothetical protein AB0O31_28450 [Kitasatospora cineracea]|uniref:hypothetical protein n=1 Tax=Kitasatospora TaxID=2063 RepID=UPI0004C2F786|nr:MULTISPECIES: hypothetical protein [unclassified Kitasatospora]WAL71450.1 hypothetical protein OU787_08015 [Kitasatospora sp. YST-16]WNW37489.1 hypothetical protein RKE32_07960 [Streptomyces sp. Li-HN-5-13]
MVIDHSSGWLSARRSDESEAETLAELLDSSRRLGRFWPVAGPVPAVAAPAATGVRVPVEARRLVAAMPEYGG